MHVSENDVCIFFDMCDDNTDSRVREGIKPHNLIVKLVAVYVGTGLVMMEILYFGVWCRPFSNYWAVPTPNGWSKSYSLEITC